MSTDVDTTGTTRAAKRDRVFLAVVLLTGGAMLLTDRLVPGWPLGNVIALVLGLELLVWAFAARSAGATFSRWFTPSQITSAAPGCAALIACASTTVVCRSVEPCPMKIGPG